MPKPQEQRNNTRAEAATDVVDPVDRIRPYKWKKGQSGNPGGRPRGRSLTARLREVLEQEHHGRELMDLLAERFVREALSGKFPFAKEILDRLEGLPGREQRGNEPVRIVVVDVPGVTPVEREGTADDILALMAPAGSSLRELRPTSAQRTPGTGPQP